MDGNKKMYTKAFCKVTINPSNININLASKWWIMIYFGNFQLYQYRCSGNCSSNDLSRLKDCFRMTFIPINGYYFHLKTCVQLIIWRGITLRPWIIKTTSNEAICIRTFTKNPSLKSITSYENSVFSKTQKIK